MLGTEYVNPSAHPGRSLNHMLKCFAKSLSWDSSVSQEKMQGMLVNLLRRVQGRDACAVE